MTNAEAIVELRYQKKMSCMGVNYQANEEVIDMAIAALEKQEGEGGLTMAEYIKRDAALSAVDCGNLHKGIVDALQENIKDIPAADVVEVRHAKDVYKQYTEHHCEFMCSLCGRWIGVIEGGDCDFNYCPNCGAKMTEV